MFSFVQRRKSRFDTSGKVTLKFDGHTVPYHTMNDSDASAAVSLPYSRGTGTQAID